MSEWVQTHLPCPRCSSSDAYSINDRGWGKCFSCGASVFEGEEEAQPTRGKQVAKDKSMVPHGEYRALTKRKITEETCKKFGYFIGEFKGQSVQVAPYYDSEGTYIAQKIRFANKDFLTRGEFRKVTLFGQQLWGEGGKKLIITEGEIDCMSVSQLQGNKWPVVSIPNGAQASPDSNTSMPPFSRPVLLYLPTSGASSSSGCKELWPERVLSIFILFRR